MYCVELCIWVNGICFFFRMLFSMAMVVEWCQQSGFGMISVPLLSDTRKKESHSTHSLLRYTILNWKLVCGEKFLWQNTTNFLQHLFYEIISLLLVVNLLQHGIYCQGGQVKGAGHILTVNSVVISVGLCHCWGDIHCRWDYWFLHLHGSWSLQEARDRKTQLIFRSTSSDYKIHHIHLVIRIH